MILGCGNTLFGDDGFGSALVGYLEERHPPPPDLCLLDVGTGVRKLLFTLCLSRTRPRRILVLDAVDLGRAPGDVFEMDTAWIPSVKLDDFSLHQLPTSNLLRELKLQEDRGVEVRVLACQPAPLPDVVRPGLSPAVRAALPRAAAWVVREYFGSPAAPGTVDTGRGR